MVPQGAALPAERTEAPFWARSGPPLALTLLVFAYAALALYLFSRMDLIVYPDTSAYESVASRPIFEPPFFAGERPFTLPLLLRIAGSEVVVLSVQVVLYLIAWSLFALVFSRLARSPHTRIVLVTTLLLVSVCTDIFAWNASISSESLSISLLLLALPAAGAVVTAPPRPKRLVLAFCAFGAIAGLWVFDRDINGYLLVILAGIAALASVLIPSARRYRGRAAALFGVALALCVLDVLSADRVTRWKWPLVNVLGQRILPSPEYRLWFAERGMPLNE